jgi:peptidylprolyl isomerase
MATAKRERQKAARRQKLEEMQRVAARRRTIRRALIVGVIAVGVIVSAALIFSGNSSPTTTTTSTSTSLATTTTAPSGTTTTVAPASFAPVASPSPAGVFGKAPTVVVPAGNPPTAMQVSDLIHGTGAVAKAGSKLTVQYVLATYSSRKVVQSSWTSQPFSFTLGVGQVITGWDEGMVGMRVGGRREMIIPPSLGYHAVAAGPGIAANDTLVFVVDLLKVQ